MRLMLPGAIYKFKDCGQIASGSYHSTINSPILNQPFHILLVDGGDQFYPVMVSDDRILSTKEDELHTILNDQALFKLVMEWFNKHK